MTEYIEHGEDDSKIEPWREWFYNGVARAGEVGLAFLAMFGFLGVAYYSGIHVSLNDFYKNSPAEAYVGAGFVGMLVMMKVRLRKIVREEEEETEVMVAK